MPPPRSTRRIFWPSLLLVACAILAACGRESGPASGAASGDYFPLVVGARWVYRLRSGLGDLEMEVVAKGEMPVQGRDLRVFVMEETNRGPSLGFVETAPVGYLIEHGFVARLSALDYDREGRLRLLGQQDVPSWFLPVRPRVGESWAQESRLFSTPEGGGARLGWSGEIRKLTTITVPAGTFPEALAVHIEYHDPTDARQGPAVVYDDYYVRGIGLVRSSTTDPSGDGSHAIETVLVEYRFPR